MNKRDKSTRLAAEPSDPAVTRPADGDVFLAPREYWLARIPLLPSSPELPLVAGAAFDAQLPHKRRDAEIDAAAWRNLKEKAADHRLTPAGVLLAAYAEVLAIWSKHAHFIINLELHDSQQRVTSNLLEIDNTKGKTFEIRARHQQQQLRQDLDHRQFSGIEVRREIARVQGTGAKPVAPVVFTNLLEAGAANGGSMPNSPSGSANEPTSQWYLNNAVQENGGGLSIQWNAVDELFPSALLDDMFQAYRAFLRQLAADDSRWHQTLAENTRRLLPAIQTRLLAEVNNTAAPVSEEFLHTLFIKRAAEGPERLAVITPSRRLTYEDVYARACRVEEELLARGLEPNQLAGIVMEKGWEEVVAALGVLFAGGAYMPIDPDLPPERQRYLIENGDVKVVLTQSSVRSRISVPDGVDVLAVDQIEPLEGRPLTGRTRQKREDLAYVIYTSGSTGQPKGVMTDHCGAVNTVLDINRRFEVGRDDRVLAVSRLNFDLSVYDIFGLLAAGGTVVMPAADRSHDAAHWARLVSAEKVTLWNTVPSLMGQFLDKAEHAAAMGLSIRTILLSGDWIPISLPSHIRRLLPEAKIMSLGGATEASIWSILYPIEQVDPNWKSIPYGRPMANQTFFVLNEAQAPCPVWVPGQLYIGGIGLARGYWRDARKTHASFIHHPSGQRLYRTGDWGRYLPDGNIEFLGREDAQVKLYGYRIELGEVEAKLQEHPDLDNCVVVVREDASGGRHLVGYVIAKPGASLDSSQLRGFLRAKLPEHMVPAAFVVVDHFPLTPNGKVDRKALPAKDPADWAGGILTGP